MWSGEGALFEFDAGKEVRRLPLLSCALAAQRGVCFMLLLRLLKLNPSLMFTLAVDIMLHVVCSGGSVGVARPG